MKANNLLVFSFIFIMGCNNNGKFTNVNDKNISKKPVSEKVIRLNNMVTKLLLADSTKKATAMVDSLILKNKNDGSLFYEKGFILEYNMDFEEAIPYFKKAENLGYNKKFCLDEINFCKKLINERSHLKNRSSVVIP